MNGKTYIGSSINLSKRITQYFSLTFLARELKKGESLIYKSLGKHGYSNFSFEILEYCDPDKAIEREQYYLDQLQPKYNILKTAGSSLSFKHSAKTLTKFKSRKHSEEAIAKMKEKALTPERL